MLDFYGSTSIKCAWTVCWESLNGIKEMNSKINAIWKGIFLFFVKTVALYKVSHIW